MSKIVTTGQRNVSGELAKYRRWDKHRCVLKQEDRYPNDCDFEMNVELWKELEVRYPDLAAASTTPTFMDVKLPVRERLEN